ncbi:MAG: hypothetical protein NTV63_01385 [Candidatus Woesearchaeota archaeon]|nr:hypothetical protein [Candidatus Woesearchaeota archaeon]
MISKKDLLIISELRKNSRESLTNMSKKIHIPISTIYDRLRLNEGGLIRKNTSLIDFSKIGFYTHANLLLKAEDHENKDALKEFLIKNHNINSVFRINNGFDFLAEGVFKHIKELEEFLENLEGKFKIQEKQVYYIIEELKREAFLSDGQLIDMIQKEAE